MENTAIEFANTFLRRAKKEDIKITPMKLQKLLFILYKEFLQSTGTRLFEERFEAWQFGPVLSSIYSEFKLFRASPITSFGVASGSDGKYSFVSDDAHKNPVFADIFESVWNNYKNDSAIRLSEYTHKSGGAWDKSIKNQSYILNDEDIKAEESYKP